MFDKNLNDIKHSTKEELNKKLAREDDILLLVVQEMCQKNNLDSNKTNIILERFSNSYFYANAFGWFNEKDKIDEKKVFIENGKKIIYESNILNELVIYFIKYNADPNVDEEEVKNFLKGFIFNAIFKALEFCNKKDTRRY